jgi:hypothetical protein
MVCLKPRARGPITEPVHFASRPWTQAEDDKLQRLALTGLSSRAIGIQMNRTETAVRSRARQMQVILGKNQTETIADGLKAKGNEKYATTALDARTG